MRLRHWAVTATLVLLAMLTGIGIVLTRDSARPPAAATRPLIDETPLKDAHAAPATSSAMA
jgi:hypothetical protein